VFVQNSTFYPTLGQERDLLAHLEQWAKDLQAQGVPTALMHQLFNPEGPTFVSAIRYRDLADFENYRQKWRTDATFQANLAKALSFSIVAPTTELFEILVPLPS